MIAYPSNLILTPSYIDEHLISPSRVKERYKLNEWRNIFAEALGFKSFHHMAKNENVLFIFSKAHKLVNFHTLVDFMSNASNWYVPDNNLGLLINDEDKSFWKVLHDIDRRGLWVEGYSLINLGPVSISKSEAERLFKHCEERLLEQDWDFEQLEEELVNDQLFQFIEKQSIKEFWWSLDTDEERNKLLECCTMPQLYTAICKFLGQDGEESLALSGCNIYDLIQDILDDEESMMNT